MGLRETLNQNPAITTGATAGLIVIALTFILWNTFSGGTPEPFGTAGPPMSFYTVDDGATFVADTLEKRSTAFQISGKPAVIAHVYSCDGKTRFVGWLERYTPEALKALHDQGEALKHGKMTEASAFDAAILKGREMKRPKEATWVKGNSPAAAAVVQVKCPDGKGDAMEIMPD